MPKCKHCRVAIDKRAELCLPCRKTHRLYEAGAKSIQEAADARQDKDWRIAIRQHAAKIVDTEGAVCEWCGYSNHVQRAHIRDIASFPRSTPLMVVNNRDNILLLCPNCHWEFDNECA